MSSCIWLTFNVSDTVDSTCCTQQHEGSEEEKENKSNASRKVFKDSRQYFKLFADIDR